MAVVAGVGDSGALDAESGLNTAACWDPVAFGLLYDHHVTAVYRYFYRQTGSREEAEDLTSLTFMKALAGLRGFRAGQPFKPWLLRIAHNALIDHRRRASITVPFTPLTWARITRQHAPCDPIDGEGAEAFLTVTAGLPSAQRDALALHYIADLTLEQTARVQGRSVAATKMLVSRALKTLRQGLHPGSAKE